MADVAGRNLSLSLPRRFLCDLLHYARQVPAAPVQRSLNLARVAAARRDALRRPSWCALFTKALAIVAAARPSLRRVYLSLPRPHLYEHPHNVAAVGLGRRWGDEEAVFFAHLRAPEKQPLLKLDASLRRYQQEPLESIGRFRRLVRLERLPWPVRRFAWWLTLNGSGRRRARQVGTFGVSGPPALGCELLQPLLPVTTTLHHGTPSRSGRVTVRLFYDHRVLDGATAAQALLDVERALHHEILEELLQLQPATRSRPRRRPAGGSGPSPLENFSS
jgi:hypothetical protein